MKCKEASIYDVAIHNKGCTCDESLPDDRNDTNMHDSITAKVTVKYELASDYKRDGKHGIRQDK